MVGAQIEWRQSKRLRLEVSASVNCIMPRHLRR